MKGQGRRRRQGTEALYQLKSKVERLTERRPNDRESKEKNINYGGLFGRPGEKSQAAALSIKRVVKLRSIKRCKEGLLPWVTLNRKEQHASTGGESPGGRP